MKEHFKPKSLLFYGTMITTVVILFRITSAYGEANLKAPPNLNGRYISTEAPPGCPASTRLTLDMQQSGIYVNGILRLEDSSSELTTSSREMSAQERPTLTGQWKQPQIVLSGETDAFVVCQANSASDASSLVNIQGQIQLSNDQFLESTFTGQLTLDGTPWQFTAQRQTRDFQPEH
ncbi:MAG: hypothetical protein HC769_09050 [Cyanobacteria bacterium CRU_2_1]|nr:hypothetical protein [Cyanobacteria bacterium RU_5_0]NJR58983.1 hypothetical protein [Cyanobacteria bacterium CRU_2_1]